MNEIKNSYEINKDGVVTKTRSYILKHSYTEGHYPFVMIDGKKKYIHRLLAEKYIPNPDNKPTVNHIDGNKQNNNLENLEWNTYSENNQHAVTVLGRKSPWQGKTNSLHIRSKKIIQFSLDSKKIKEFPSMMEIKRTLGFAPSLISQYCSGKRKTAYGFHWEIK